MRNGESVAAFEREFAAWVGAKYAIALNSGTSTLHTALVALGVQPGDRVAVPPLTMSATTLAVLQAGAVPVFCDVDPGTWVMARADPDARVILGVSLYGLHWHGTGLDYRDGRRMLGERGLVDDAAQTLAPFEYSGKYGGQGWPDFKSYSFQASKILALGEGGMLATNDEALATRAREFSSLGYRMRPDQPRIDPAVLKSPDYARHHWPLAFNYRMNDLTAREGLRQMDELPLLLAVRREAAAMYADAIRGCDWLTPQHVPEGWSHDYWAYAVALDFERMPRGSRGQVWPGSHWHDFAGIIVRHGGEMPYGAWRLSFDEPAFRHLDPGPDACSVARDLQPRLLQGQTNNLASAERNAEAWRKAIKEIGG